MTHSFYEKMTNNLGAAKSPLRNIMHDKLFDKPKIASIPEIEFQFAAMLPLLNGKTQVWLKRT